MHAGDFIGDTLLHVFSLRLQHVLVLPLVQANQFVFDLLDSSLQRLNRRIDRLAGDRHLVDLHGLLLLSLLQLLAIIDLLSDFAFEVLL